MRGTEGGRWLQGRWPWYVSEELLCFLCKWVVFETPFLAAPTKKPVGKKRLLPRSRGTSGDVKDVLVVPSLGAQTKGRAQAAVPETQPGAGGQRITLPAFQGKWFDFRLKGPRGQGLCLERISLEMNRLCATFTLILEFPGKCPKCTCCFRCSVFLIFSV